MFLAGVATEVISVITAWITGMLTWLLSVIEGVIPIFYDTTTDKLTVVGILALFGLAVGLVRLGLNFVRSFFIK